MLAVAKLTDGCSLITDISLDIPEAPKLCKLLSILASMNLFSILLNLSTIKSLCYLLTTY